MPRGRSSEFLSLLSVLQVSHENIRNSQVHCGEEVKGKVERGKVKGGLLARYNHSLTAILPAANHIALASTTAAATVSEGSISGPWEWPWGKKSSEANRSAGICGSVERERRRWWYE